jgi:hypothetical protein
MGNTGHTYSFFKLTVFIWMMFLLLISGSYNGVFAGTEDVYKNIEVLSEVLSKIEKNYVEDTDPNKLIYGAIKGMV